MILDGLSGLVITRKQTSPAMEAARRRQLKIVNAVSMVLPPAPFDISAASVEGAVNRGIAFINHGGKCIMFGAPTTYFFCVIKVCELLAFRACEEGIEFNKLILPHVSSEKGPGIPAPTCHEYFAAPARSCSGGTTAVAFLGQHIEIGWMIAPPLSLRLTVLRRKEIRRRGVNTFFSMPCPPCRYCRF